jgi:antitoxin component YwqK of YwqJK toxin-antitoxin module
MLNVVSKTYTRRGEVQNEIGYKNNKKHGAMKVYNRKGKLMLHVLYKNGVRTKSLVMRGQEARIMYKYGSGDKPKKNKSKKTQGSSILR